MGTFKEKNGKLFFEFNLGKTSEFVRNMLESTEANITTLDSCIELVNAVSMFVLKNFNKREKEKYFSSILKFKNGYKIAADNLSEDVGIHYFIKDRHLGDATRTLSLISVFKNYHKKNNTFPVNKTVVITVPSIADLGKIYRDIDEFIVLNRNEISDLVYYLQSSNENKYQFYLDNNTIDSSMKKIYMLPENISFANDLLRLPSTLNDESFVNAKKILNDYNIVPSKSIILLPYSYSSSSMSEEMLSKTINFFIDNGYTVFTNVGSESEKTFQGTHRLSVPPTTLLALGKMGCLMIGTQSGVMDTMLWLRMNLKCIICFLLLTNNDIEYAKNRALTKRITNKENAIYIMLERSEVNEINEEIIQQSEFYIKGNLQYNSKEKKYNYEFYKSVDLNQYISELLKVEHIVIFISVFDSANTYWNNFESRHLLGLKEDLTEKWRLSYVAIIDADNNVCEERISNQWRGISYQYCFNDISGNNRRWENELNIPLGNNCWLYSCAMDSRCYTKSAICINGIDYSMSKRGLNIVIYSKEQCSVIDSINVDSYADESLTIRRKSADKDK